MATSYFYFAGGAPNRSDAGTGYRADDYETWTANQGVGFHSWYPDDDADGDGQKNLVEFALGSNPRSSASMGALKLSRTTYVNGSTTWPAMRFDRPIHSYQTRTMHYRMQGGADLKSWGTARYSTLPDSTIARYYRAENTKAFYRLAPKYPDFTAEDSGGIILAP